MGGDMGGDMGGGMKEAFGNLWEVPADLRVISTNGIVRRDGACVMGRGCALEAKDRFPGIDFRLGELLREHGNRVMRLGRYNGTVIASFPVKNHWKDNADPALIRCSAEQLVALADKFGYERVAIPRPGCGNGKLSWTEVRAILADILDDRFTVITFPKRFPKRDRDSKKTSSIRKQKSTQRIEGPCQIELRAYGSADDLGLGRYRPHILDDIYPSQEAAEKEISYQETLIQASGAIATMVPVPAEHVPAAS